MDQREKIKFAATWKEKKPGYFTNFCSNEAKMAFKFIFRDLCVFN